MLSHASTRSRALEPDPECIRNKVWQVRYQWFSKRALLEADGPVQTKSIGYNCSATIPGQALSDAERDDAWKRIEKAAKKFGVELHERSWRELGKPSSNSAS